MEVVGKLRFRFLRVKQKDCLKSIGSSACYETSYGDSTKEKSDFNNNGVYIGYKSASSADQSYSVTGYLATYGGGGLVTDIDDSISVENFRNSITNLNNSGVIDQSLRAIIIEWTFFCPSLNLFTTFRILFEFSAYGIVLPSYIYIRSFELKMNEDSTNQRFIVLNIVRFILSFYFLVTAGLIFHKGYSSKKLFKYKNVVILAQILTHLLIFCFSTVVFSYSHILQNKHSSEYLTRSDFYPSYNEANMYEQMFIFDSLLLLLLCYKFLSVFRGYLPLQILMSSIENTAITLIFYLLILLPVILSFAIIYTNMYSAKFRDLESLVNSLLSFFLMCIGQAPILDMMEHYRGFTFILTILFYLFTVHLLIVVFSAFYTAKYREIVDAYGYPGDLRLKKQWGIKNLLRWCLICMPEKILLEFI